MRACMGTELRLAISKLLTREDEVSINFFQLTVMELQRQLVKFSVKKIEVSRDGICSMYL